MCFEVIFNTFYLVQEPCVKMSKYADVAIWLAVNFVTTDNNHSVTLNDVYKACSGFYENLNHLCKPVRETIGKLIPRVFKVKTCLTYSHGEKFVTYQNLIERQHINANDSEVVVPSYCTYTLVNNTHVIKCPLTTIVNDVQQHCLINLCKDDTLITVNHTTIKCGFPLKYNQQNMDGLLDFVGAMKLCNGIESENTNEILNGFITESVSLIPDTVTHTRQRAKFCKVLLHWLAQKDTCEACKNKYKRQKHQQTKQRKSENAKCPVPKKSCIEVEKKALKTNKPTWKRKSENAKCPVPKKSCIEVEKKGLKTNKPTGKRKSENAKCPIPKKACIEVEKKALTIKPTGLFQNKWHS